MDLYSLNFHDFVRQLVTDRHWKTRFVNYLTRHPKKIAIWNHVGIPLYTLFPSMDVMCADCQGEAIGKAYFGYCIYCYFNYQCSETEDGDLKNMMVELGYPDNLDHGQLYVQLWEKWKTSALLAKRLSLKKRLEVCLIHCKDEGISQFLLQTCTKFDLQLKNHVSEIEVAAILNSLPREKEDTLRYKLLVTFGYNLNVILPFVYQKEEEEDDDEEEDE